MSNLSSLNKGLVGSWDLKGLGQPPLLIPIKNSTVKDVSLYNNTLTFINSGGSTYVSDRDSVSNSAIYFSSNPDRIDTPEIKLDGDFSVSVWFNMQSTTVDRAIIGNFDYSIPQGWCIYFRDGEIRFLYSSGSGNHTIYTNDLGLSTGVWYHLAVVKTNEYVDIYVNGNKQLLRLNDTSELGNIYNTRYELVIGNLLQNGNYGNRFNGYLSDLILYKSAISEKEILRLYNEDSNLPDSIFKYTSFQDKSPNNNPLVNNGAIFTTNKWGEENKAIKLIYSNSNTLTSPTPIMTNIGDEFSYRVRFKPLPDTPHGGTFFCFGTETSPGFSNVGLYSWNNRVTFYDITDGITRSSIGVGGYITDDVWIDMIVTYKDNNVYVYRDGQQVFTNTSGDIANKLKTSRPYLWLGRGYTYSSMEVDIVNIYDKALTPQEIRDLASISKPPVLKASSMNKGLVGKWDFGLNDLYNDISIRHYFTFNNSLKDLMSDLTFVEYDGNGDFVNDRLSNSLSAYSNVTGVNFIGTDDSIKISNITNQNGFGVSFWYKSSSRAGWIISINGGKLLAFTTSTKIQSTVCYPYLDITWSYTTNWTHICITSKGQVGDDYNIYLNGVLAGSVVLQNRPNILGAIKIFSNSSHTPAYSDEGIIDELILADKFIPEDRVLEIYNSKALKFMDKSVNNNPLVNNGATFTTNKWGEENKAISVRPKYLYGKDIELSGLNNLSVFTMVIKCKPIFDPLTSRYVLFWFPNVGLSYVRMQLAFYSGGGVINALNLDWYDTSWRKISFATGYDFSDEWVTVALSWDNGNVRLSVNDKHSSWNSSLVAFGTIVSIYGWLNGGDYSPYASLENIEYEFINVYDRILSEQEIEILYRFK